MPFVGASSSSSRRNPWCGAFAVLFDVAERTLTLAPNGTPARLSQLTSGWRSSGVAGIAAAAWASTSAAATARRAGMAVLGASLLQMEGNCGDTAGGPTDMDHIYPSWSPKRFRSSYTAEGVGSGTNDGNVVGHAPRLIPGSIPF